MSDLISRQDAIDAVRGRFSMPVDNLIVEVIGNLPSAQPERKKGKWIEEIGMLMCSECGDAWGIEQEEEVRSFNFCPNCGAKMECFGKTEPSSGNKSEK